MKSGELEWDGVGWGGEEWNLEWSGLELNGKERKETEQNIAEHNRVDQNRKNKRKQNKENYQTWIFLKITQITSKIMAVSSSRFHLNVLPKFFIIFTE